MDEQNAIPRPLIPTKRSTHLVRRESPWPLWNAGTMRVRGHSYTSGSGGRGRRVGARHFTPGDIRVPVSADDVKYTILSGFFYDHFKLFKKLTKTPYLHPAQLIFKKEIDVFKRKKCNLGLGIGWSVTLLFEFLWRLVKMGEHQKHNGDKRGVLYGQPLYT